MGKRMKKFLKSALSVTLAVCMAIPASLTSSTKAEAASTNFVAPEDLFLISYKEYAVAPGITEVQTITNTADGNDQEMGYAVTIDLSNPNVSLGAGYANYDGTTWAMQTARKQAYAAEKANGYNVVAAVNADFFNMATGCPSGPLVMKGVTYHKSNNPYFAILKDGSAVIRNGGGIKDDVLEAVGGSVIMLVDGEIPTGFADAYYTGKEPRTAVGIKADGSVVLFVGDGRQYPKSSGLTIYELAKMMKSFGCVTAMNLDGGGSSTFLTEREGESELMLHNSPSDGAEREVSSSLFVYTTAKADGIFDHAVLEPNEEAYTPYSDVLFTAAGVDKAGCVAQMPSDVKFELAEDSAEMGTITSDGLFTSNGKEGAVTVNLCYDGRVAGSTSIDIIAPNYIGFSNDEVSFGFSQESNLGLVVKNSGRDLLYNDNDFVWTLSDPSMGSFNGNIFTSSDSATVTGTITCTYKYNTEVSGSVTAIIGKLPTIVWDFENPEEYTGLSTSNYGRGGAQSAEIVSIDDDEPVRFGKGSLKLNYNFINCGAVTEGACVGMTDKVDIPGVPTGIGVWVYAPEGTATTRKQRDEEGLSGFWLRGYFTDGAGRQQAFDYTLEPKQVNNDLDKAGIYWEGWQYCEADLTKYAAPYSIEPGMAFRLMYVAGTKMGTKTAGSIYFDNLQFVYGANVDDIDAPVIDTIQGNDVEITDGTVFDTNTITFTSTFHDIQNKYTTGIDYEVVRMYLDGKNVVEDANYVLDKGGNKSWLYDVELANGTHSLKMLLRDGFGNETTETRFFTVDAQNNESTTMTLVPSNGMMPVLGKTFSLDLVSNNVKDIASAEFGIKLDSNFNVNSVNFADGFTGEYSIKSKVLTVKAEGAALTDSNVVASVVFDIPASTSAGVPFTYATTVGTFNTNSESTKTNSFAVANTKLDIIAPLSVEADAFVVGLPGMLVVRNLEGQAVEGATVYNAETGAVIGTTDANGELITEAFSAASGKYSVYAVCGDEVSFSTFVYSVNAVGDEGNKPYNVLSNASVSGNFAKNLTWMSKSNVEGNAFAKVATKADYEANGEAAFELIEGSYVDKNFLSGSASGYSTVRVNKVNISGLSAGTEYVYCVGDGNVWSDIDTFKTDAKDDSVNFFIIGDIQAKDLSNNTKVINGILNKGLDYSFGVQTGDAVDGGAVYSYWNELIDCFDSNGLKNIDMVHVLGNHEYEGDGEAANATDIYNLPANDMYSVEYDNLYVAVINYKSADNAALAATGEWLVQDAAKSNAQWKILLMHQPPYYTNIQGGGDFINRNLPKYLEEAGINMVFSGHDHTLARTLPLTAGEVDEENGIVYYICGSTGEKSYAAFNTPEFHFAYTNDTFDAVYTTVQVNEEGIAVINYDLDGSVLDSYIMGSECAKTGHEYIYDGEKLVCDKCGHEDKGTYVGFAKDQETGKTMYFYLGEYKTGVVETGDGEYIFDENGLGIDGEYVAGWLTYTVEDGKVTDKNGIEEYTTKKAGQMVRCLRLYINGTVVQEDGWIFFNNNWYYITRTEVCYTQKNLDGVVYKFNKDGTHTVGTFKTNNKGTKYYFAGELMKGLQVVEGDTYFFSKSNGVMVTDKEMEIDGFIYTFGPDGKAVSIVEKPSKPSTGFWKEDGHTYYFVDDEMVTEDWVEVEEGTFYFDANGYMLANTTTVIDNCVCKFNADGTLESKDSLDTYSGFLKLGSKTYFYTDGVMAKGWTQIEEDWYYFLPDTGLMVVNSKTIDGVFYKFGSDGKLLGGVYKTNKNGTRYYFAGKYVTGLFDIDGATYYFDKSGYLKANATVEIDNMIYTTDENGMVVSVVEKPTKPSTGFWTEDGHTYYYVDDVMVVNGWVTVEEGTFYFDGNGYMVTKTCIIDNCVCTFNEDGSLASKDSLDSYDGFLTIGGKTYFYEMGVMAKGWKNISENWYYFMPDTGEMVTAPKTIDGVFYQFNADGTLKSGTWKNSSKGSRYYIAGDYVKGLQTIDGLLYFFDNKGYKVTNTTKTIDGVTYVFDENGVGTVYVEPVEEEPVEEEPVEEQPVEEPVSDVSAGDI